MELIINSFRYVVVAFVEDSIDCKHLITYLELFAYYHANVKFVRVDVRKKPVCADSKHGVVASHFSPFHPIPFLICVCLILFVC